MMTSSSLLHRERVRPDRACGARADDRSETEDDDAVKLLAVAMAAPLVCHGHSRPIVNLEYSNVTDDGVFLISSSKDGQPMLRNGETGDWIGTFEGHKGCVWGATLNAPATHGATASADFSARLWNAITGDELHCFAHKHIVKSVCFSQDCQKLLTGGSEKLLRIYDLANIDAPPYEMQGSPSQIRTAQFTAEDTLIVSSCVDDPGIRVW